MKTILTEEQIKIFLDAFEQKVGRKTMLIDLDGVAADFEATAEKWARDMGISVQEFKDKKLYRQANFYYELELMPGAKEAIETLALDYEITFVSAPSWDNPASFTEKRLWIAEKFGEWARKRLDLSFKKGHYFGHYLIDDRTKYGAGDFIGEHIMFGTEPFQDWAKVVEYLKSKN